MERNTAKDFSVLRQTEGKVYGRQETAGSMQLFCTKGVWIKEERV